MSNITLDTAQRQSLLSLSQVTSLLNRTEERLNTGKKVNAATDNPVAFFRSESLTDRANSLLGQKSNIDQSVQAVSAALDGTSAIATLLNTIQGQLLSAQSGSLNDRISATAAFKTLGSQLAQLVDDTSFQGLDLLNSTSTNLSTQLSDRTASTLVIQGFDLNATATANRRTLFTQAAVFSSGGNLIFSQLVANANLSVAVTGFSALDIAGSAAGTVPASVAQAIFVATENRISTAITQLQGISSQLASNVSILQARANFTTNYTNTLTNGSDALTLADFNTEAANSQALTLRQQLGIQALSTTGQVNSSILTLLK
jgi:flagellin